MMIRNEYTEPLDPHKWPGMKRLLTVPRWLGGAHTARYILNHAWTRWAILWPLLKLRS